MNKIAAVVGMCGSGKSIACDVLKNSGWNYIRFGQITIDSLKEQGKPITPENEKETRESLRKQYGMGAFAFLSLPKINIKIILLLFVFMPLPGRDIHGLNNARLIRRIQRQE